MAGSANLTVGDPTKPASADRAFQSFTEQVAMPAMRLCRLARSLLRLKTLGGAPQEELEQMREDHDGFFHGEFLLHIGTKLAYKHRAEVLVVPRAGHSGKTPDLSLPGSRLAIECVAHEKVEVWENAAADFEHADGKFADWFGGRPGWTGVVAIDLGFRGSPTLPDLGFIGPNHTQIVDDIKLNFDMQATIAQDSEGRHRATVNALVLTWSSVECEEIGARGGIRGLLHATDVSALQYAPGFARRVPLLDQTFHEFPSVPERTAYRSPSAGSTESPDQL